MHFISATSGSPIPLQTGHDPPLYRWDFVKLDNRETGWSQEEPIMPPRHSDSLQFCNPDPLELIATISSRRLIDCNLSIRSPRSLPSTATAPLTRLSQRLHPADPALSPPSPPHHTYDFGTRLLLFVNPHPHYSPCRHAKPPAEFPPSLQCPSFTPATSLSSHPSRR